MHHLDVPEEVKRRSTRPRRRVVLRPIGGRIAASLAFERAVTKILAEGMIIARDLGMEVAAELKKQLSVDEDAIIVLDDAALRFGYFSDRLRDWLAGRVDHLASILRQIFGAEETRYRVAFTTAVKAASGGIDITPFLSATDVQPHIEAAMLRSTSLVRGLTDAHAKALAQDVINAATHGKRAADLAKDLTETYKVSAKRARVIARDQVAELNAQMNKVRQQQVGVEKYSWQSSRDERVRKLHGISDGQIFRWDEPGPDDGMHPGEPIMCRCIARAVLEFD